MLSLLVPAVGIAKFLGYDRGAAVGLYAGSQTLSASMGLGTDAINRLGLAADQVKPMLDIMPVAYAITYIFGTVGSAIIIAIVGPPLLGINLVEALQALYGRARRREGRNGGRRRPGISSICALIA